MPRIVQRLGLLAVAVLVIAGLDPAGIGGTRADAQDSPFAELRGFDPAELGTPRVAPEEYAAVDVDLDELASALTAAPRTQGRADSGAGLRFDVPTPEGGTERFSLQQTRLMAPGLAADNPEITTYAGRGIDDPTLTVALDITPMGFHAAVRAPSAQRAWFVDPAVNERGTTEHVVYYGSQVEEPVGGLVEPEPIQEINAVSGAAAEAVPGGPVDQRVYRVAIVSDPSYAAYFGTENVLAEKVTLMNRVNQIYNDDLAISMELVEESDALNLDTEAKATGADGPCGTAPCYDAATATTPGDLDGCGGALLGKNRTVLGQLVGADDYDIGHIVLGKNGGGIAYLGVVGADYKGGGCTGLPFPEGDFFAIDYVAHEMGHQFAGPHTFNGTQGNCAGGNRTARSSVEPGSGSSVMAYAGICAVDNLQPHTDPYFSQRTIDDVTAYTGGQIPDVVEVQTVSLRGFDTDGDTVTLAYEGAEVTLTRGAATYNAVTVRAAIAELTGRPLTDITIAEWGHDPFDSTGTGLAPLLPPDDRGFQVIFSATNNPDDPAASRVDVEPITVPDAAEGFVGTTAQGGPAANAGDQVVASGNTAPEVTAPADRTLPVRTPFSLTATGEDADGDALTYLWEQNDQGSPAGGVALADNAKTTGPLFRVFGKAADVSLEDSLESPSPGQNLADGSRTRVFPDIDQVLAGTTNADTGLCPTPPPPADPQVPEPLSEEIRECFSEFLPTDGYLGAGAGDAADPAMNFRVTARDGFAAGGGTAADDVRLSLDPDAGPFRVTSQSEGGTLAGGSTQEITWDVNGTQALAADVRITLSTDGGQSFPLVLAGRTANDGSAQVAIPDAATDEARIRIAAVDNYFFDVNDADVEIAAAPDTTITDGPAAGGFHLPFTADLAYESSEPGSTFRCTLDGLSFGCEDPGTTVRGLQAGTHEFTVAASSEGVTDPTPAVRRWATPFKAERLTRDGGWSRFESAGAYRGSFLRTTRAGAELSSSLGGAQRLGLVVGRGPGFGRVAVFVNGTRVRTVNLAAPRTRGQVLVSLPRFEAPRFGTVRIRTLDAGQPVRIEGLGILRR